MKTMSKKDTDRIAKHLAAASDIILKLEEKYDTEITFNKDADFYCDSILNAAGDVERVWNNTI